MTIWFLIVIQWVLLIGAVVAAEYYLRQRVRS
jgi:hypothetical protein